MGNKDPRGYYDILGISPGTTESEIKAAYRRKAMDLHPDRNKAPDATAQFQKVNEAYSVLSSPEARAQYDTATIETSDRATAAAHEEPPEPIVCHCCNKVTAQPRYSIFFEVKSFVFVTYRTARQGIFCSSCAEKASLKTSAITWLLGWWGVPWGPIYSIQAIFTNLFGGKQPAAINARLAAHQAWTFACMGKIEMARAIAVEAHELAKKIKPSDPDGTKLRQNIEGLLKALGGDDDSTRLKNNWELFGRPFKIQGAVVAAVVGFFVWIANQPSGNNYNPAAPSLYASKKPYVNEPPLERYVPLKAEEPEYVRPAQAPNGQPWPTQAGYVKGYPQTHKNGHSNVTIDNSHNTSDVFAKLVSSSGTKAFPVRVFFIPGGQIFTIQNITPGSYDIRYQDLGTGGYSGSQEFSLEEVKTLDGVEFSNVTITLYKVSNGNFRTHRISADEF